MRIALQELQSQLKDANASSAALVQRLQAEHQEAVADLETRMVELQDLQLRTDVQDTEQENMLPPAQQTLSDEARKTLQDRIAVLEAANATLENALLSSHDDQQPENHLTRPLPTAAQDEHGEPIDAELVARAPTSCRENLMVCSIYCIMHTCPTSPWCCLLLRLHNCRRTVPAVILVKLCSTGV